MVVCLQSGLQATISSDILSNSHLTIHLYITKKLLVKLVKKNVGALDLKIKLKRARGKILCLMNQMLVD